MLKLLVGLIRPKSGEITLNGYQVSDDANLQKALRQCGILFQSGALFGSMTLAENISLPLQQYTDLSPDQIREIISLKLSLVGLAGFHFWRIRKAGGLVIPRALDEAPIERPMTMTQKVLVAEDEVHIRLLIEQTLEELEDEDVEAKILAGGQSLMPMLNFRLAAPDGVEVIVEPGAPELRALGVTHALIVAPQAPQIAQRRARSGSPITTRSTLPSLRSRSFSCGSTSAGSRSCSARSSPQVWVLSMIYTSELVGKADTMFYG